MDYACSEHSYVSKLMKSCERRKNDLENFLPCDNYTVHWFEKYGFGLTASVPIKVILEAFIPLGGSTINQVA